MKKKLILMFILAVETLQATSLHASNERQGFSLHFPALAGDTVWVIAPAGSKRDTVACLVLDSEGKAGLTEKPAEPGICFLRSGSKMNVAFIRSNKETPEIFCEEEAVHNSSVVFRASPENDSINAWFARQQRNRERLSFWQQGKRLYETDDPAYRLIEKEIRALEEDDASFMKSLALSPLYAARYLEIKTFLDSRAMPLENYAQDSTACAPFRSYWLDSLDMDALYNSDLWVPAIKTALLMYRDLGNYQERGVFKASFVSDMRHLLARIRRKEVAEAFRTNLLEACKERGWHEEELGIRNDELLGQ